MENLTDEQLEQVTGGCGHNSGRGGHRGHHGYGQGGYDNGGYGNNYGGYQGPHINYNTQSLDFSQTTSLKESSTTYSVYQASTALEHSSNKAGVFLFYEETYEEDSKDAT